MPSPVHLSLACLLRALGSHRGIAAVMVVVVVVEEDVYFEMIRSGRIRSF